MNMKKILAFALCLVLVAGLSIAGTVAYLTSVTGEVKNTFTVGDIAITLTETTGTEYHIIPGVDLKKDPVVTFTADSDKCWLFVKVTEKNWPNKELVNYGINSAWKELTGVTLGTGEKVYYMQLNDGATTGTTYYVLADNVVTVSENMTKAQANEITAPSLAFQAYAIQQDGFTTAAAAWAEVSK